MRVNLAKKIPVAKLLTRSLFFPPPAKIFVSGTVAPRTHQSHLFLLNIYIELFTEFRSQYTVESIFAPF